MKTALRLSAFLLVFLTFACKSDKATGVKAVTGAAEKAAKQVIQSTVAFPTGNF